MTAPTVTDSTRIRLHDLRMRPDGEQWYVGRMETGTFVALPAIAVEALHLLGEDFPAGDVAARLHQAHGRDINVRGFVESLLELGFVAAVDGQSVTGPQPIRPTWPWLRPRHAQWTLAPVTSAIALSVPICAVVAAIRTPTYHDLFWNTHTSLILAGNAAMAWSIIALHELAHLFTARAAGVPGRISFGTRLQFLVVQTDVTGVWAAPKRVRLTVYLSGIVVNLFIAGAALLGRLAAGPDTPTGALLGAMALLSLLFVPTQFLLFMRTDLYFVLQDLARCGDLYADGSAYVRYRGRRLWHGLTRRGAEPQDPSAALSGPERRAVHAYAPVLALGTGLCLLFAATITAPTAVTVLIRAVRAIAGMSGGSRLDGLLTLVLTGGFWALWCRTWWRRHGPRVTAWLTRRGPVTGRR